MTTPRQFERQFLNDTPPVAEKLRMLDALRERALTLRTASGSGPANTDALREKPAPYRTKPE